MDQRVALDGLEPPLVTLHSRGAASSPLILASPHAGRDYRAEFLAISRLDMAQLRRTEDAFVDQLFQDGPSHGVPLLCANFPRSWLDVNRDEWELDPAMFADQLPAQAAAVSARAAAGLGAIPRVASQGAPIYRRKAVSHAHCRPQGRARVRVRQYNCLNKRVPKFTALRRSLGTRECT